MSNPMTPPPAFSSHQNGNQGQTQTEPPRPQLNGAYSSGQNMNMMPQSGTVTPLHLLGDQSDAVDCPFCERRTMTRIKKDPSWLTQYGHSTSSPCPSLTREQHRRRRPLLPHLLRRPRALHVALVEPRQPLLRELQSQGRNPEFRPKGHEGIRYARALAAAVEIPARGAPACQRPAGLNVAGRIRAGIATTVMGYIGGIASGKMFLRVNLSSI